MAMSVRFIGTYGALGLHLTLKISALQVMTDCVKHSQRRNLNQGLDVGAFSRWWFSGRQN